MRKARRSMAGARRGGRGEPERTTGSEPEAQDSGTGRSERRLERASALARESRAEQAAREYRELIAEDPGNAAAHAGLGALCEQAGDRLAALAHYEAARDADPENVETLSRLGGVLAALQRFADSERELRRALRLDPRNAEAAAKLGILFLRRGLYAAAEMELRHAIEFDPDLAEAYLYRGEALNQLGRVDEALAMLERAAELQPGNAKVYYTMGILFDKKHLRHRAEEMFRRARSAGGS